MRIAELLHNQKKSLIRFYNDYFTINGLYTSFLPDKIYIKKMYKKRLSKKLNLRNPKTFCEKLNWLKLYDRRSEYTLMADKIKSRDYIMEKTNKNYFVPLIGVWKSPEEIDFDSLPNQFVLKCNHDNGVIICRDKSKLDIEKVKKDLNFRLKRNYYKKHREWPYKDISRLILCEKYMSNENEAPEIDFKFFCFNGIPRIVRINSGRFSEQGMLIDYYDMNWKHQNIVFNDEPSAGDIYPKPKQFYEMKELASELSQKIPFLRVDFNYWNNTIWFGELTFYDEAGVATIYPNEWNQLLGSWIKLPKKKRR